jgi:hypothetical protein
MSGIVERSASNFLPAWARRGRRGPPPSGPHIVIGRDFATKVANLVEAMRQGLLADIIYTLMSPEVHRILTMERGWSPDRYERWLATALRAQWLR